LNKFFGKFSKWSTDNKDFVSLARAVMQAIVLLAALIGFIYATVIKPPVNRPGSWFDRFLTIANISIAIPFYVLLLVIIIALYSYNYFKKQIILQLEWKARLIGDWLNRWAGDQPGQEFFTITNEFKYILFNGPYFEIRNFRINPKRKTVKFTKVGIKDNDKRILKNMLSFKNFNELKGLEQSSKTHRYEITYTKLGCETASNPYLKVAASSSLSENPDTTNKLKLDFHFQCLQNRSIAIHSIRFEANPVLQIENKADRFIGPNSYNCNATLFKKEHYVEEVVINKATAATCWVPFNPEVGKFNLDKALEKKLCGTLFFHYAFVEDRTKSHLYIAKF
jgi:hypothetical protein